MKYLFRITPGKTPFHVGSAAKSYGYEGGRLSKNVYVSPALYSWINHYFNHEDDRVFAIERPSNMNPITMCCGINSVYHYVYTNKDEETITYVQNCIIHHDFKNKVILELTNELNERVKRKFGKTLKQMKGGTYLGTLMDWDRKPVKDAYPEIILEDVRIIRGCKWEELEYIKDRLFIGKQSGKEFMIEYPLDKYGLRYRK